MNAPQAALNGQQIGDINNAVYPNGPPNIPTQRIAEVIGSTQNRGNFLFTEAQLNMMKGRIMNGDDPVGGNNLRSTILSAQQGNWQDFFAALARVFEVFNYMRDPEVRRRQQSILGSVEAEARIYQGLGAINIVASTEAYHADFFNNVATRTQSWIRGVIAQARAIIPQNGRSPNMIAASDLLDYYESQINDVINFDGLL